MSNNEYKTGGPVNLLLFYVLNSNILNKKIEFLTILFNGSIKEANFPSDSDKLFFSNSRWKAFRPSYFAAMLGDEIQKVSIPSIQARKKRITPREFRHSFAIISYMNNSDMYAIMCALGHEKIEKTMIYLQKVMDREQHVVHQ